jgi:hypothetical protein
MAMDSLYRNHFRDYSDSQRVNLLPIHTRKEIRYAGTKTDTGIDSNAGVYPTP